MMLGLFAFSVNAGVAKAVVAPVEGGTSPCSKLKGTYKTSCDAYVVDVAKCATDDTACGTAAYKKYVTAVCKTDKKCAADTTKVIAQEAVATTPKVGAVYPSSQTYGIDQNPIVIWLKRFINLFASIIGVGAIVMIAWGGLQYASSRDNPQAVQAAKTKITNVVIGLAAFIFFYAFIQWLIPGGAF